MLIFSGINKVPSALHSETLFKVDKFRLSKVCISPRIQT